MYKVFNVDNTSVRLTDKLHNNNSWSVYPNRWNLRQITLGTNESPNGKCLEYGECSYSIRNANILKTDPLKFLLTQPTQRNEDGMLLKDIAIVVSSKECIVDNESKNGIINAFEISNLYPPTINYNVNKHIMDIINGDMDFITEVGNNEIKIAKENFYKTTGFDFDTFKDSHEYYKTIRNDVQNFIKKINPYIKSKLGLTLCIIYDPLCIYGEGEWVSSEHEAYGREGEIREELEKFWLNCIYWNRTHPDNTKGIPYKIGHFWPYNCGELDIKKFFQK